MDEMQLAGKLALEQASAPPHQKRANPPTTLAGFNAIDGSYRIQEPGRDAYPVASQGALTTGGIQIGHSIQSYSGRAVDWKPVPSSAFAVPIEEEDEGQQDEETPGDDEPGEDGGDDAPITEPREPGEGDTIGGTGLQLQPVQKPYCSNRTVWWRTTGSAQTEVSGGDPPFFGGQCQGAFYRVQITRRNVDSLCRESGILGPFTQFVYGPILYIGPRDVGVRCGKELASRLVCDAFDSDGNFKEYRFVNSGSRTQEFIAITDITRLDGPDDCGDPSPAGDPVINPAEPPGPWNAIEYAGAVEAAYNPATDTLTVSAGGNVVVQQSGFASKPQIEIRCSEEGPP